MKTCAAVLAGCAAVTALAGETALTVDDRDLIELEPLTGPDRMVVAVEKTIADAWSVRSTVRVIGAELAFATDPRLFETHDYRINVPNDRAGFTSEPGPINAVEIVLLENLHPQFLDFSSGSSEEISSTSTTQKMTSFNRISWNAIETIIAPSAGTASSNPGSGGGLFRSASGGAGFTDEVVLPVHLGSGDGTYLIYPLDWVSNHEDNSNDSDSNGKFISSSSVSNGVMIVPLPLPAVLTGIGLVMAVLARRRFRT